jgi:hypothetical protein
MTQKSASTAKIFRMKSNPDEHDYLVTVLGSHPTGWSPIFSKLSEGMRCADGWQPVPMERLPATARKNRGKPVDIICLMGLGFAFSDRAVGVLTPLIGDVIELLPLAYDGPGRFQVVNLLDIVDCLDEERSSLARYSDGEISIVYRYVFKPGNTDGHHLFKCKQCLLHDLVSAEFKARVEEKGLVGAYFTPVGE